MPFAVLSTPHLSGRDRDPGLGHSEQKRPTWGAVRAKEAYKILTAAARKRLFLRTLSEKFRVRADLEIGKGKTPEYIPTTDLDSVL